MDWTSRLEGIRRAIATAALLPDVAVAGKVLRAVAWENEKGANRWVKRGWVDLEIDGMRGVGQDETRQDFVPGATAADDRLIQVVTGNRLFHVTCKCESDDQTPNVTGQMIAERIRSRIRLPSVRAIHQGAAVALNRISFGVFHDYRDADSRRVSQAVLDIVFQTSVFERDDGDEASTDFILEVSGEGELEGGTPDPKVVPFDTALEEP